MSIIDTAESAYAEAHAIRESGVAPGVDFGHVFQAVFISKILSREKTRKAEMRAAKPSAKLLEVLRQNQGRLLPVGEIFKLENERGGQQIELLKLGATLRSIGYKNKRSGGRLLYVL